MMIPSPFKISELVRFRFWAVLRLITPSLCLPRRRFWTQAGASLVPALGPSLALSLGQIENLFLDFLFNRVYHISSLRPSLHLDTNGLKVFWVLRCLRFSLFWRPVRLFLSPCKGRSSAPPSYELRAVALFSDFFFFELGPAPFEGRFFVLDSLLSFPPSLFFLDLSLPPGLKIVAANFQIVSFPSKSGYPVLAGWILLST